MFRRKAEDALLSMGITPNYDGFQQIIVASEVLAGMKTGTKVCGVYEIVAEKMCGSNQKVERTIRHAVSKANRDSDFWKRMGLGEKATNGAFLSAFTLLVKRELEDDEQGGKGL